MSYCSNCGSDIALDSARCPNCKAEQDSIPSSTEAHSQARFPLSQILAGVWITAAIGLMIFLGSIVWLLTPSIVACLWPLLRNPRLSSWVERQEERLANASSTAQEKTGKIARYFSRPLFRGFLWIWQKTETVADCHVRAGARVGATLYFGGIMVFLAALVGYVVVALVVAGAVILFMLWLAGHLLSGKPFEFGRGRNGDEDEGPVFSRDRVRASESRPGTDFFGNPKTDVFNNHGEKVGEIRPTTDFFGDPKEEVFDKEGNKIGERQPDRDFFGSPVTKEYDSEGEKVGKSRPTTDFFGDPVEEHYDNNGDRVGESRPETDFFGNPVVKHTWKKKGASG